jgi:hypothetical protein
MIHVTIPLRPVVEGEIGTPEEYYKVIQDEYAERFLAQEGIASTPANKAAIIRENPLLDCEMHSVWREGSQRSAIASEILIAPTIKKTSVMSSYQDDPLLEQMQQWYGVGERIPIAPPYVPPRTIFLDDGEQHDEPPHSYKTWGVSPHPLDFENERDGLSAELKRIFKKETVRPGQKVNGGVNRNAKAAAALLQAHGDHSSKGVSSTSTAAKLDMEKREVFANEVAVLKRKFILPFCIEKEGEFGSVDLVPWPKEGPLDLIVPKQFIEEVSKPIDLSFEDIQSKTQTWIKERLPLELLTTRRVKEDLEHIRTSLLVVPHVARLIGLLAHLLYWLTLSKNRPQGDVQLSHTAKQSMYVAVHEQWSWFEKHHRCQTSSRLGVNLVLPCLMLTLKQGVELCFFQQYKNLMADTTMNALVVDRINTMMMRLVDPQCQYAHFGKGDGTGKAILLSKQLEKIASKGGTLAATHKICQLNRCSPLVSSVVRRGDQGASHARTRAILKKGEHPEFATAEAVKPPTDAGRQRALLQAALMRLDQGTAVLASPVESSLAPQSARRGVPK